MDTVEEVESMITEVCDELAELAVSMAWCKCTTDLLEMMRRAKLLDEERVELWHHRDHLAGDCRCDEPSPNLRVPPPCPRVTEEVPVWDPGSRATDLSEPKGTG